MNNALYLLRCQLSLSNSMPPPLEFEPPTFSKAAAVATPDITLISDLSCGHPIEDSEESALDTHSKEIVAVTCNMPGQVRPYPSCVVAEDGEEASKTEFTNAY